MATFEVDGREYELLTFDKLDDLTLGDLTIFEEKGGMKLSALTAEDGIDISVRLFRSIVLASMLRTNPEATFEDTAGVPLSVMQLLANSVNADGEGEEEPVPPTTPGGDAGLQP